MLSPLLGEEEEGFFLVVVVVVGNVNGSTESVTVVVLLVRRPGVFGRVVKEIVGVKEVVAGVFEGTAMETRGSALGLDFNGAGAVSSVLSSIIGGQHPKFGDGLGIGINVECAIAPVIHVVAAVDLPVVIFGAPAVHAVGHAAIDPDPAFILACLADDAGSKINELSEVPVI